MIAALFPGQNSQVVGMAKDFYEQSPAARALLERAESTLPGLLQLMWEGPEDALKLTANQQPALVAAAAAAFAAYREAGGELPTYAAGHSLGEFSAHVAAESLKLADALILVRKRGEYMQAAVPEGVGAMAAIMKTDREHVERVCRETAGVVEVANLNSPEQTVISGEAAAVIVASERLKNEKARVIPLKVSAPFHCSLMRPAAERLALDLAQISFQVPAFGIICNVTADLLGTIHDAPNLLERQVTAAVRWVESIKKLQRLGVTRFIEFGSGRVLTGLVSRIIENADARAVTDMASLREAL
jgi:[acyl-carrier-protein] S-malonyltransferase